MITEVILPQLGQTMEEGAIVDWVKKEGEPVSRGDVLFTVESDKAVLEVEATARGFLRRILVPEGQPVPVLTVVALITREADEDISSYGLPGVAARAPTFPRRASTGAGIRSHLCLAPSPKDSPGKGHRPGPAERHRSQRSHRRAGCTRLPGCSTQGHADGPKDGPGPGRGPVHGRWHRHQWADHAS